MRRLMPILLVLAAALATAPSAPAADQTLSVVGQGVSRPTPDEATVTVSLRRVRRDPEAARNSVNRRARTIIDAAVALDIPRADVQTSQISLDRFTRRLGRRGRGPRVVRYRASMEIDVGIADTDLVGRFLDRATALGASDLSGPEFSFSSPTAGRAEAEQAALTDARRRADAAAAQLGLRIVGIRSVDLDFESFTFTDTADEATQLGASAQPQRKAVPTPVEAGTEEVLATVAVIFIVAP
jgi:uncharacterized protein YggE